MLIAPSILNADNMFLGEQIQEAVAAGITRFHIDVMDGHFVSNLSYGPQLVKDFKRHFPNVQAEVHLMGDKVNEMVPVFADAGADLIEFHYEAVENLNQIGSWADYLHRHGSRMGVALNPSTDVKVLTKLAAKIDQALIMTVFPGFGGQKFLPDSAERIRAAKEVVDAHASRPGRRVMIEVDGGINAETAKIAQAAGADVFVAGSYIFGKGDIAGQVKELTAALTEEE